MRVTAALLVLLLAAGGPGVSAQLEVMEVGSLIRTGKHRRILDISRIYLCGECIISTFHSWINL